nr:MAG TPA: hypothetical protein [Caudoviricetes sp.]
MVWGHSHFSHSFLTSITVLYNMVGSSHTSGSSISTETHSCFTHQINAIDHFSFSQNFPVKNYRYLKHLKNYGTMIWS